MLFDLLLSNKSETFRLQPEVLQPIACLGAPMPALAKELSKMTSADCHAFKHGAVGGAIGAALARKHVSHTVWIQYLRDVKRYRAHLPREIEDFEDLDTAVEASRKKMFEYISSFSSSESEIKFERNDHKSGNTLYFGTELLFSVFKR